MEREIHDAWHTGQATLVGTDGVVPGRIDDRAGHHHRQRRPALDPRRPAFHRDLAGVGGERLHADLRRLPAAGRTAGRPARPPAHVPGGPGPVHRGIAGLWAGAGPGPADRRARRAGAGRRGGVGGVAVAHHESLHRGRRTRPRHGRVRLRLCGRRQPGRAAGRAADQHAVVALDLPGQHSDRRGGVCAMPAAVAGGARRGRRRPARRGRRAGGHRVADAGGVRRGQRQRGRLDLGAVARPAGRGRAADGAVPGDRGARGRAADAAGAVPPAQRGHRQRGRGAVGRGHVRVVLRVGAVHAAGAGL
ncbi:hypothetical protein LMG26845_04191 [Achromobacter insuavis]|uniref:Uncharacterized protein n=1 Tax=Achromobacter insuavis TaxID=1287735 RepID=A0A6J5AUR1_9BURK|nr:hypothetical protein LMG26845_04191 [Achromobacter insuavis]